jgi:hypothetical protein
MCREQKAAPAAEIDHRAFVDARHMQGPEHPRCGLASKVPEADMVDVGEIFSIALEVCGLHQ